jgi:hypothetical protein
MHDEDWSAVAALSDLIRRRRLRPLRFQLVIAGSTGMHEDPPISERLMHIELPQVCNVDQVRSVACSFSAVEG